jgi:hypothetical protein
MAKTDPVAVGSESETETELIEALARAIYNVHRRGASPTWDNTSDDHRDWLRAQVRAGLAYLRARPDVSV